MSNTKKVSLVARLEDAITHFFYGREAAERRKLSYAVGLQVPLWVWTHQAPGHREEKEFEKVSNLISWMNHNHADLSRIAVITSISNKRKLRERIQRDLRQSSEGMGEVVIPVIMSHHELGAINLRDHTTYTYDVVLYMLDLPADINVLPQAISQEEYIGDAIAAAKKAFVLLMDVGWTAPAITTKWPLWKNFLGKLKDEQPHISKVNSPLKEEERMPSLMGSSIPLCCSLHPNHRQLEYGLTSIVPKCKHLCIRQYACGKPDHVCNEVCHPHKLHNHCPFVCKEELSCGHQCMVSCSARCNCFHVIEKPLACSHTVVLGLDKESLQPIYGTVRHTFKGVCADADLPCAVTYNTECARCLGPLEVKCFEAQEQQHTSENRTLVCGVCRRVEREQRMRILGDILRNTESEKQKMKVELQRTLHQQRKAATQGLFTAGVRVEISDCTKCVPPLFAEEDFPGLSFVDLDDPSVFERLQGAYGTFISHHVDLADRTEVRNLVRLPDGLHVLVVDGGLNMIRAVTAAVTDKAALLLTFHSPASDSTENAVEFQKAKEMVGQSFYLSQPVPVAELEEGFITDKVVSVVSIDPASSQHVIVECCIVRVGWKEAAKDTAAVTAIDGNTIEGSNNDNDEEAATKKPRTEKEETGGNSEEISLRFSAPMTFLEPMKGYQTGQYVYVSNPERQIQNPHDMELLTAVVRHTASLKLTTTTFTATPVDPDTPYELMGVVNAPAGMEEAHIGPCALLRQRQQRTTIAPPRATSKYGRRRPAAVIVRAPPVITDDMPLVAIPFVFTVPDELTEAENALDAAALQAFEKRLHDVLEEKSEEMSLRNDEEAFHAQQLLGAVTEAKLSQHREALSIPVPLPTPEVMAAAKNRQLTMPSASPVSTRLARNKEALICKMEALQGEQGGWMKTVTERCMKDADNDAAYIRTLVLTSRR